MIPNQLIRSVIRFDEADDELALSSNLFHLRQEVEPQGIDGLILKFVGDIFDKSARVPGYGLVLKHFTDLSAAGDGNGPAGTTRLEQVLLAGEAFITGADFRYALDQFRETTMREVLSTMLNQASMILTVGAERQAKVEGRWQKQTIVGVEPTVDHIAQTMNRLNAQFKRGTIEGSFRKDADKVRKQYEFWRNNPGRSVGVLSGIDKIDMVHRGLLPGDLALVMGFVSHMKSSFCLNWLYKAAVNAGKQVAIASLEMTADVLRILLYVMHSAHKKFEGAAGFCDIDFDKVTTGSLSADEEAFFERVIHDFETCPDYGEIFYKEPQEAITIGDIQRWAESLHRRRPLDLLVIDYLGLVDPEKNVSGLEQGSNLNRVIRQAKIMATSFGGGRGIPVLSPFQANREGLKEAEKNAGRYKLTALSMANEAERSADYVYYTYLDDTLRTSRELSVGNLKARNRPVITELFKVYADPGKRVIENLDLNSTQQRVVDLEAV